MKQCHERGRENKNESNTKSYLGLGFDTSPLKIAKRYPELNRLSNRQEDVWGSGGNASPFLDVLRITTPMTVFVTVSGNFV
jgi:hypothetical protein